MASVRRMGPRDSEAPNALLDATERVLRNEGYAAASSRRVAQEAGLKQQLVYYYFHSMDDLLLATFQRRTGKALSRLAEMVESDQPLAAIWQDFVDRTDARLAFEFVALANHHEGIRREVAGFIAQSRALQAGAIARQWEAQGVDPGPLTPGAAAFLMYVTTLMLGREEAMGVTDAHDDIRSLAEWALGRLKR